jgi:hypothetical protein
MFNTKEEVKNWLEKYSVKNYTINEDLTIDVEGDVNLQYRKLSCIPIIFNKVSGSFMGCFNNLTSLKGCPKIVLGCFLISNNNLTSLKHCPEEVGGDFVCHNNQLKSLEHITKKLTGGGLYCENNQIVSLKHCPEYVENSIACDQNPIENLDDFICDIKGFFFHSGSIIPELENLYKKGELELSHKKLNKTFLKNKLEKSLINEKNDSFKNKI